MKKATYETLEGTHTVEYDDTAPIRIHYAPNETPNYPPGSRTACGILVRDVMATRDYFTNKAASVDCGECVKEMVKGP